MKLFHFVWKKGLFYRPLVVPPGLGSFCSDLDVVGSHLDVEDQKLNGTSQTGFRCQDGSEQLKGQVRIRTKIVRIRHGDDKHIILYEYFEGTGSQSNSDPMRIRIRKAGQK
jgi:hypothetical protein